MAHPLTDDICTDLVSFTLESEHDYIEMRAAADWQLEQVINWLIEYIFDHSLHVIEDLPEELAQSMRPTQEENG